jgi:DNA-binding MarR family transcriptional regulator
MSTPSYRFGDLLALARMRWVQQMAAGVGALGYEDYRRSDAAVMRLLKRAPLSIGGLGDALGVTRQAGRKVVSGLEQRGYATTVRDQFDSRQTNVVLTAAGEAYAQAVIRVIDRLNQELADRVDPVDLAGARRVLAAVLNAEPPTSGGGSGLHDH